MKRLLVILLVLTMFPAVSLAAEKEVTFTFNYTLLQPVTEYNPKELHSDEKVSVKTKVTNFKKGEKLVFSAIWSKEHKLWEIQITEGAEYIPNFPIVSISYSAFNFTSITWEYTFGSNLNKKIKLSASAMAPYRSSDYLQICFFDQNGKFFYSICQPYGKAGTYTITQPKFISDGVSSTDSVEISVAGYGLEVSTICLLGTPTSMRIPKEVFFDLDDNCSVANGVLISKALYEVLVSTGKDEIFLPTTEAVAAKVTLPTNEDQTDVYIPYDDITLVDYFE